MLNLLQTESKSLHNLWMLADSEQAETKRLTASGLVTDRPCLLLECGGSHVTESSYVSPTSHSDPDSVWRNEPNIYDNLLGSFGACLVPSTSWSGWLELIYSSEIVCSGCRFYAGYHVLAIDKIGIDYWDGSVWVDLYEGIFADVSWVTKEAGSLFSTTKFRVRFYNTLGVAIDAIFIEFDFISHKVLDVTLYDGFDNSGSAKHRIVLSSTGSDFKRFDRGVYFANGLYAEFAESVGECFIRYKEVGR